MTPAQRRALAVGIELNRLNSIAAARAIATRWASEDKPWVINAQGWARWLMSNARLDEKRRQLRELLADALEATQKGPRHAA